MKYAFFFILFSIQGMDIKETTQIVPYHHKHHHHDKVIIYINKETGQKDQEDPKELKLKYKLAIIGTVTTIMTTGIAGLIALIVHNQQ